MANFIDRFERPNGAVGNNWKFHNKHEKTPVAWTIEAYRAIEDTNRTTLMGRYNPVAVGATHQLKVHLQGKNAGEVFFRWSATGGAGNYRWAVVYNGVAGKLVRRQSDGTTEFEHVETTWDRHDDFDTSIRVDLTATTIVVYDSNALAPETAVANVTSDIYANATGVGVGSGSVDTFELIDLESYTASVYDLGRFGARPYADVMLTFADADAPAEPAVQKYAALSTESIVVLEGIPHSAETTLTPPSGMTVGTFTVSDSGSEIDPALVDTDADYRWLPQDFVANELEWRPHNLPAGSMHWNLGTYFAGDPRKDLTYTYSGSTGLITRPAMVFNGGGFLQLDGYTAPDGTNSDFSIAVVAVLHGGEGPSYSLFQTDRSSYAPNPDSTQALKLKYSHGLYSLEAGGPRASYERKGVASGASIIVLSLNPNGLVKRGYLMIQDTRRFSAAFNLRKIETFSPALFFGAEMSHNDDFTRSVAANMDVLEIDMWDRALSPYEMRRYINQMAPLYGVVS